MSPRLCLLVVAVLGAVILLPAAGRADNPVLVGDVGLNDGYNISLENASGAEVLHLDPGTYTLVVHDHSALHDFRLKGPGVNVATDVEGTGDSTFTITLVDGNYSYICDVHAYSMHGGFTAGTPPPVPVAAHKLAAHIGPGRTIGMRGTAGLAAGKALVTVADSSRTDNFRLTGPGVAKATGVAFKGTVRWSVSLRAGRYTFRSDAHRTLHGSFTVAP
jgi:hypothetical protein